MSGAEPALRVVAPGLQTTVQDLGRHGYGRFGLPVAGALDDHALRWANLLAGNDPGAAALEIPLLGPTLTLEADRPVVAALAGADLGATLDGAPLAPWRAFTWRPGQTLALGGCHAGMRAYLAVRGGVAVPAVFGSRSTDPRGGIGGLGGRALRAGDRVPLAPDAGGDGAALALPADLVPAYGQEAAVRVVLGPQDDRFTPDAIVTFLSSPYRVTRDADRMGLRLEGPALAFRDGPAGADILSEGIATGAIQVPGHGQPIVLLAAHQTTGGYAKIATVIGADLWRLGQARPGDAVRFRAVSVAEAQEALRAYQAGFDPAQLVAAGDGRKQAASAAGADASEGATVREQVADLARALGERLGVAAPAGAGLAAAWGPEAVRDLLDHFARLGLAEFEIDVPGLRLHLRGAGTAAPDAAPVTPAEAVAEAAAPPGLTVAAPFIGIFYRAAKQGDPPLVEAGATVEPDQPLGLIEVMKTFHQVTAGYRARVAAVLAEDGAAVEYGQPLFRLEPLAEG
ncbi:MAG TPA: 5-oxoprolinase/urea amidolyase family protein [Thermomicrobiales bacterium]|nr:5-oxoprolinase/urea amidolyase family protein [Thermomicrobiales bacterium]